MTTQRRRARRRGCGCCATTAASTSTEHDVLGTNARLDTLQAAVLAVKLPPSRRLERGAARARRRLRRRRSPTSTASTPIRVDRRRRRVYHQYVVRVADRERGRAPRRHAASARASTTRYRSTASRRSPDRSPARTSRTPTGSPRGALAADLSRADPDDARPDRRAALASTRRRSPVSPHESARDRRSRPDRLASGRRPARRGATRCGSSTTSTAARTRGRPDWIPADAEFVEGDIRDADMRRALPARRRGRLPPGRRVGGVTAEIAAFFDVNATGTALIFETIQKQGLEIRKLVAPSSQAIYGEGLYRCDRHGTVQPQPRSLARMAQEAWEPECPECGASLTPLLTHEDAHLNGETPYAASKIAEERIVIGIGRRLEIPTVALRYAVVSGRASRSSTPTRGSSRSSRRCCSTDVPPRAFEDGLRDARLRLRAATSSPRRCWRWTDDARTVRC